MSHRAIVLRRGRVTMSGSAKDLMSRLDEIAAGYLPEHQAEEEHATA